MLNFRDGVVGTSVMMRTGAGCDRPYLPRTAATMGLKVCHKVLDLLFLRRIGKVLKFQSLLHNTSGLKLFQRFPSTHKCSRLDKPAKMASGSALISLRAIDLRDSGRIASKAPTTQQGHTGTRCCEEKHKILPRRNAGLEVRRVGYLVKGEITVTYSLWSRQANRFAVIDPNRSKSCYPSNVAHGRPSPTRTRTKWPIKI